MSDQLNVRLWLSKQKRFSLNAEGRQKRFRRNLRYQAVPYKPKILGCQQWNTEPKTVVNVSVKRITCETVGNGTKVGRFNSVFALLGAEQHTPLFDFYSPKPVVSDSELD